MMAIHPNAIQHMYGGSVADGAYSYTELQTVDFASISSLITSSNMCLTGTVCDSSCSEYTLSQDYNSSSSAPHSPQSVYEGELSDINDILQRCMSGTTDDDDDDKSVMFDFEDLAFLDKFSRTSDVAASLDGSNDYHRHEEFHRMMSSEAAFHTSQDSQVSSSSVMAASSSTMMGRHSIPPAQRNLYDYSVVRGGQLYRESEYLTPHSLSPGPKFIDNTPRTAVMSDVDEEEEDDEYKPYCDSRRGAKKNLLWKFLLSVLETGNHLAEWTDIKKGVFKFVDTAAVSKMWGLRKHKKDMTFEKLSRGIRHYYRRGLMERMPNTRLVYKFNWEKVPKKYRKA